MARLLPAGGVSSSASQTGGRRCGSAWCWGWLGRGFGGGKRWGGREEGGFASSCTRGPSEVPAGFVCSRGPAPCPRGPAGGMHRAGVPFCVPGKRSPRRARATPGSAVATLTS